MSGKSRRKDRRETYSQSSRSSLFIVSIPKFLVIESYQFANRLRAVGDQVLRPPVQIGDGSGLDVDAQVLV